MQEYLCLTVLSRPGEGEPGFKARLSRFWTGMLRGRRADYERVFAESAGFEPRADRLARQYLIEPEVADRLEQELRAAGVDHDPVDRDDLFSRYEAVAPDWMQVEH